MQKNRTNSSYSRGKRHRYRKSLMIFTISKMTFPLTSAYPAIEGELALLN